MKIPLGEGPDADVIDTADHDCSRFIGGEGGKPCVFCDMNAQMIMHGRYAIPFDIPGVYDGKTELPNVKIVKLPKP